MLHSYLSYLSQRLKRGLKPGRSLKLFTQGHTLTLLETFTLTLVLCSTRCSTLNRLLIVRAKSRNTMTISLNILVGIIYLVRVCIESLELILLPLKKLTLANMNSSVKYGIALCQLIFLKVLGFTYHLLVRGHLPNSKKWKEMPRLSSLLLAMRTYILLLPNSLLKLWLKMTKTLSRLRKKKNKRI